MLTSDRQATKFMAYCMLLPTGTDVTQQQFSRFHTVLPHGIKRTMSKISITPRITKFQTDTLFCNRRSTKRLFFKHHW